MIEITLTNLLDNALKFTPAGGEVRAEAWADTQGVHIVVDDTGKGIPKAEWAKIFDEYYQVGSFAPDAEKGAGLGLYVARRFVELHGGWIGVVDKPGPGTRIELVLPR